MFGDHLRGPVEPLDKQKASIASRNNPNSSRLPGEEFILGFHDLAGQRRLGLHDARYPRALHQGTQSRLEALDKLLALNRALPHLPSAIASLARLAAERPSGGSAKGTSLPMNPAKTADWKATAE